MENVIMGIAVVVVMLIVGGWAFHQWREYQQEKREESESESAIYDLIEDAIALLRDRLQAEMRLLDREKVKQIAHQLYVNHVRGTPLAVSFSTLGVGSLAVTAPPVGSPRAKRKSPPLHRSHRLQDRILVLQAGEAGSERWSTRLFPILQSFVRCHLHRRPPRKFIIA